MRIIAGKLKGSILYMPKDKSTRPLKDLVKEMVESDLKKARMKVNGK